MNTQEQSNDDLAFAAALINACINRSSTAEYDLILSRVAEEMSDGTAS